MSRKTMPIDWKADERWGAPVGGHQMRFEAEGAGLLAYPKSTCTCGHWLALVESEEVARERHAQHVALAAGKDVCARD